MEQDRQTATELAAAQDAMFFSTLFTPPEPTEKELDKVKEPPHPSRSREREER